MDQFEQTLKDARLSEPSSDLDRRINNAFAAARGRRSKPRGTRLWWWMAALLTAGSGAILIFVSAHRSLPASEVIVYEIEAQGRLREMLLNPRTTDGAAPQFVYRSKTP